MKFNRETAARFFIVAWVKDWSVKTYLDAIGDGEIIRFEDAHSLYPWLPDNVYLLSKASIRRITAELMRPINDMLWDAGNNEKRLAIAKKVESWVCDSDKFRKNKDAAEFSKNRKRYQASRMEIAAQKEWNDTMANSNWNVVK